MPSSYTTNLKLTLPVSGELTGTWGDTVNTGITALLDSAIAGTASVAMTDANRTLTTVDGAADEARQMFIVLTGTLTAARDVVCPSLSKLYFVKNSTTGGFAITFKTSAGTGISVPSGLSVALYCDGTNVLDAITFANIPTINATTVDTTNLEVTNIKAKDGTAAITLADSTGVATIAAAPILTALTASQAVFTNGSKALVSNAITGTGSVVMSTSPTLVTPALGTPTAIVLTSGTGLPISTGVSGLGTNVATFLGAPSSANLLAAVTDETGTGSLVFATNPTLTGFTLAGAVAGGGNQLNNVVIGASTPLAGSFTTLGAAVQSGATNNTAPLVLNVSNTTTAAHAAGLGATLGFQINSSSGSFNGGQIQSRATADPYASVLYIRPYNYGNTDVIAISSTGLAVTGAISATGAALANGINCFRNTTDSVAFRAGINVDAGLTTGMGLDISASTAAGTVNLVAIDRATTHKKLVLDASILGLNINGVEKATLDSAGNLGLGVTPSAWSYTALQVGSIQGIAISSFGSGGGISCNAYDSVSGWRYVTSAAATKYQQNAGSHSWDTAPSGTAGAAITFTQAMTLDASGNLHVPGGGGVASNEAFGTRALLGNTTGSSNTAVGYSALQSVTTGIGNTALGAGAGGSVNTGSYNVNVGVNSGVGKTTGQYNISIGYNIYESSNGVSNAYHIGSNTTDGGANTIKIGNGSGAIVATYASSAAWSFSSDERVKKNIENDLLGLTFINRLHPKTYNWKPSNELPVEFDMYREVNLRDTDVRMHGLIAQNVKAALDEEGVDTFEGWSTAVDGMQMVSREMFVLPLINAVNELTEMVNQLKAEIAVMKGQT